MHGLFSVSDFHKLRDEITYSTVTVRFRVQLMHGLFSVSDLHKLRVWAIKRLH